jgi:O-antigen/teichoic acid export membrane protein
LALNFAALASGEFLAKALTFAVFTFLARVLGPARYGNIEFTLAAMVFFTLPVDFGLGTYGAREIARNPRSAQMVLNEVTALRAILAACSFALLLVFIAVIHKPPEVKALLSMYAISLAGGPFLLQWFFQAFDAMHWVAIASIVRQGCFAGLVFLFVRAGSPLIRVAWCECASIAAACLFGFVIARRIGYVVAPHLSIRSVWKHLAPAMPIGLTEFGWAFMWYFAIVLLGFYRPGSELGWFGASHRVSTALHTFVWLYFFNLLPSLSRCVGRPRSALLAITGPSMAVAAWSGIFVALATTLVSKQLLVLAYGARFAGAAPTLTALGWMIPIAMLSGHYRFALIAYNRQLTMLYSTMASAAVAVALAFVLIPRFGAMGAAYSLLAANLSNFALVYFAFRGAVVAIPFLPHLVKALAAFVAAIAVAALLHRAGAWVSGAAGIATYATALIIVERRRAIGLLRFASGAAQRSMEESWAG